MSLNPLTAAGLETWNGLGILVGSLEGGGDVGLPGGGVVFPALFVPGLTT